MVECFVAVISRSTEPTIPWFRDHYCWSLKKSQVTHKDVVPEEGAQWPAGRGTYNSIIRFWLSRLLSRPVKNINNFYFLVC